MKFIEQAFKSKRRRNNGLQPTLCRFAAPASTSRSQRIQSPINSSYTPMICFAIFSQV